MSATVVICEIVAVAAQRIWILSGMSVKHTLATGEPVPHCVVASPSGAQQVLGRCNFIRRAAKSRLLHTR